MPVDLLKYTTERDVSVDLVQHHLVEIDLDLAAVPMDSLVVIYMNSKMMMKTMKKMMIGLVARQYHSSPRRRRCQVLHECPHGLAVAVFSPSPRRRDGVDRHFSAPSSVQTVQLLLQDDASSARPQLRVAS